MAGLHAGRALMEGDLGSGEQGALEAAASGPDAVAPLAAGDNEVVAGGDDSPYRFRVTLKG